MSIFNAFILLILLSLSFKQIYKRKDLLIHTRIGFFELFTFIIGIIVISVLIFLYAINTFSYILGVTCIILLSTLLISDGISSYGFLSSYRYKPVILWNEITKITICKSSKIKLIVHGSFMEQTFYFHTKDFEKIKEILVKNIPTANFEISFK